jgi:homoserine kinase type II
MTLPINTLLPGLNQKRIHPDDLRPYAPMYSKSSPQNIICQACPNGCHLHIHAGGGAPVKITGNQCQKGIDHALRFIHGAAGPLPADFRQPTQVTGEHPAMLSREALEDISARWGLKVKRLLPCINIEGSPERSLFRTVFEDTKGDRFILEQIPPQSRGTRIRIAETLTYLKQQGLNRVRPYLPDGQNRYLLEHKGQLWQIAPFIPGTALDRQTYLYEQWRGGRLADFLIALKDKTEGLPFFNPAQHFSLKDYVLRLFQNITRHNPPLAQSLQPIMVFLEKNFFHVYNSFPVAFCHGDYHPLNIIWATNDIKIVIDWEFAGYKPEIYDTANMIGCIGIEHPSGLLGGLVSEFIHRLRQERFLPDTSWDYLVEFVIAVRFGWLSEWLRKSDTDMIEMETVYMKLLMAEKTRLRNAWF